MKKKIINLGISVLLSLVISVLITVIVSFVMDVQFIELYPLSVLISLVIFTPMIYFVAKAWGVDKKERRKFKKFLIDSINYEQSIKTKFIVVAFIINIAGLVLAMFGSYVFSTLVGIVDLFFVGVFIYASIPYKPTIAEFSITVE